MSNNKKKLEELINSLIDGNDDQASTVFHDYLGNKTKEFIRQPSENSDSDSGQQ